MKLTDTSWPIDEFPSRSSTTSTVNTSPEMTSEGAFAIEYEGAVGVAVGLGTGPAWATKVQTVAASATRTRDSATEQQIVALDTVLLLVCEA